VLFRLQNSILRLILQKAAATKIVKRYYKSKFFASLVSPHLKISGHPGSRQMYVQFILKEK
jgi:hypothetical protein